MIIFFLPLALFVFFSVLKFVIMCFMRVSVWMYAHVNAASQGIQKAASNLLNLITVGFE